MTEAAVVVVAEGDPSSPYSRMLLSESAAELRAVYAGKRGGPSSQPYDPAREEPGKGVFLVARVGKEPAGCGAVALLAPGVAEVKQMYVLPAFRRRGIARQLLHALERAASGLGARVVLLVAGARQGDALALYESSGYAKREPYGEYVGDPNSVCFEKDL